MNEKIEIKEFTEDGYSSVVSYGSWRVAMLNYIDELEPENIDNVQAHLETDEVFVLLKGRCILYLCDVVDGKIVHIDAVNMRPQKIYNVKKGVFHTHTLSKEAKVLIVENENTNDDNSPKIMIGEDVNTVLVEIKEHIWK